MLEVKFHHEVVRRAWGDLRMVLGSGELELCSMVMGREASQITQIRLQNVTSDHAQHCLPLIQLNR